MSSTYPRIRSGNGIAVESLPDGYRINAVPSRIPGYSGFFLIRNSFKAATSNPSRIVEVVDGGYLPQEGLEYDAGTVAIERITYLEPKGKDPKVVGRQLRFGIPSGEVALAAGRNIVFLSVAAHAGKNNSYKSFEEPGEKYVYFTTSFQAQPEIPDEVEGAIFFPLAEAFYDTASGAVTICQLNNGEPHGTILGYYGDNSLDGDLDSGSESSSGDESSFSSSSEESFSSGSGESSSGESSSDSSWMSSSGESSSDSSSSEESSYDSSSEESFTDSSSGGADPGGSSSDGSTAESSGGGEDSSSGGGSGPGPDPGEIGDFEPGKWYLVVLCRRIYFHGENAELGYSAAQQYLLIKGDKVEQPELQETSESRPIVEWVGHIYISGPHDDATTELQEQVNQLNATELDKSC